MYYRFSITVLLLFILCIKIVFDITPTNTYTV